MYNLKNLKFVEGGGGGGKEDFNRISDGKKFTLVICVKNKCIFMFKSTKPIQNAQNLSKSESMIKTVLYINLHQS